MQTFAGLYFPVPVYNSSIYWNLDLPEIHQSAVMLSF